MPKSAAHCTHTQLGPPPRFKEASKECGHALAIAPSSAKALQRRARALEQLGLYKQALSDVQAINRCLGGELGAGRLAAGGSGGRC